MVTYMDHAGKVHSDHDRRPTNTAEALRHGEHDELERQGPAASVDDWCGERAPSLPGDDWGHCSLHRGHEGRHSNGHGVRWGALPLIARADPPPAVLCHGLTAEQVATVQRLADMLREGPLDREAMGREAHEWARRWIETNCPHLVQSWIEWRALPALVRDHQAKSAERLCRLGAVNGDLPLREAGRNVVRAWCAEDSTSGDVGAAVEHLLEVLDSTPPPTPAQACGDAALREAVRAMGDAFAKAPGSHCARLRHLEPLLDRAFAVAADAPTLERLQVAYDAGPAMAAREPAAAPPADTWTPAERIVLAALEACHENVRAVAFKTLSSFLDLSPGLRRHVASFVDGLRHPDK